MKPKPLANAQKKRERTSLLAAAATCDALRPSRLGRPASTPAFTASAMKANAFVTPSEISPVWLATAATNAAFACLIPCRIWRGELAEHLVRGSKVMGLVLSDC
jgi:hypothetical protein